MKRRAEAEGKQTHPALEQLMQGHKAEREIAIETGRKAREKNMGWNFNNIDHAQRQ